MYKRQKVIFLLGMVVLLAFFSQGCTSPVSKKNESVEIPVDAPTTPPTIPMGTIDTEESVEVPVEKEPEDTELLPSEPSPIGAIHISSTWIGDEYVDAVVSVDGIIGISEEISKMSARIKLRGNTSRWMEKKSYNIKFDEKISLFGLDSGKKWSLLATAYERSLLRTPLAFLYAQEIGVPCTSQYHMTELWINDEYKGVYVLIEPVEEGKNRVDIDLEQGDFLIECNFLRDEDGISYFETNQGLRFEFNEPEEPTADQMNACLDWLNKAEEAIVSMDHTQYQEYIDIESFVNYYIFEEMTKNVDFGRFSTRYHCKNGKLYAGPPWDMDLTMGNVSRVHGEHIYREYNNSTGYGLSSNDSTEGFWANKQNWYQWLCMDEYFMNQVRQRWVELLPITLNLVQENELGISRIDYLLNGYEGHIIRNYRPKEDGGAGWQLSDKLFILEYDYQFSDYTECVEYLRDWVLKRIIWLDTEFNLMRER